LIGRRTFITVEKKVLIRDYSTIGINCLILGAHHDYQDPFKPYITGEVTGKPEIKIGVNCFLSAGVTVLAGINVGYGSVIGSGSLINKDIPPFSLVIGNPCKIVKTYNFEKNVWREYDDETNLEKDIISEEYYLNILKKKMPRTGPYFHAATNKMGDL